MAEASAPPPAIPDRQDSKEPSANGSGAAKPHESVFLGEDIEIFPDRRLPQYDSGEVKAYAALSRSNPDAKLFALVCVPHLIPRVQSISPLAAIVHPSFVRLNKHGIVFWPFDKAQRYVLIYERTFSEPLLQVGKPMALGMRQEDLLEHLIRPMIGLFIEFHNKDFVHGGIRASNLFRGSADSADRIVLGECVSGPVSFAQPALYVTIENAMAPPYARGMGTQADDLYALGVCLAVLLRQDDPLEGLTDREILERKIEEGSYAALTGRDRFTGSILELLRGLLYDDAYQRWTLADVQAWLDGQRLSPKQSVKRLKAARQIAFNGEKYWRPQILALDLEKNLSELSGLIDSDELNQWIVRSLDDKVMSKRLEKVFNIMQDLNRGVGYGERVACMVSIVLDPDAPIRYKGCAVHPEGMGNILAYAIARKEDIAPFAEIIEYNFVPFWLDAQDHAASVDFGALVTRFDGCRAFLRQKNVGYGIERCLYLLNPDVHCLSDKLKSFLVRTPEDLLFAFEKMIEDGNPPAQFLDRHILAFLSVKDRKCVDSYLPDFNGAERGKQILATLKTLATIQKRSRMPPFPHIARHISGMMEPIYARYHDRTLRDMLREKIGALKEGGDLAKMAALFENPEVPQKDFGSFKRAMLEYSSLKKEKIRIEKAMQDQDDFGRGTGRQVAALVSSIVSGIIIIFIIIFHFSSRFTF